MPIFKCKMCGGSLEVAEGMTVCKCEYCGTKQTLPKTDNEQALNMFNRANHFRQQCEFDKAAEIYERMTAQRDDAELYWSIVLCRYGIEYVDDPVTKKKIPTCHRTQYKSILEDADYLQAIERADSVQREVYQSEAEYIDKIEKGILEISNKEKPFDVFICYKETDDMGRRTPDSVLAQELYYGLEREGFKVFFSRITLESKLGTEYEPYIFAALNSAKVMVVVGTKPEYFNAVWVRNEWSRYLMLMQEDRGRTLIPAYKDMDPYDLPDALSMFQAQDMSKLGFLQDLIHGIRKLVADDEPKAEVVKETIVQTANTNIAPLLKRASLFLEDKEWPSANEYCNKVLDQDPECAQAYFYMLLAEYKMPTEQDMFESAFESGIAGSKHYKSAVRFGDDTMKEKLFTLNKQTMYNYADNALDKAYDKAGCMKAKALFEVLGNFKDSSDKMIECEDKANDINYELAVDFLNKASNVDEFRKAKEWFISLRSMINSSKTEMYLNNIYLLAEEILKTAKDELGLQKAIEVYKSIEDYKDCVSKIEECENSICKYRYDIALQSMENAKTEDEYSFAEELFINLSDYSDSKQKAKECYEKAEEARKEERYHKGIKLLNDALGEDDYYKAGSVFQLIHDYKDSAEMIEKCLNHIEIIKHERLKNEEKRKAAEAKALRGARKKKEIPAIICIVCGIFTVVLVKEIIPNSKYNSAMELYKAGEYEEAITAFQALDGYKDSEERITDCQTAIKDYKYDSAMELYEAGKYVEAYEALIDLNGYKDSSAKAKEIYGPMMKTAEVGDVIKFGKYNWYIIERNNNEATVLCEKIVAERAYNESYEDITWEDCTLRKWLNNDFYNEFSDEEKTLIAETTCKNEDNSEYGTKGGNDTNDHIYLLSIDEAKSLSTDVLKASGGWWLRSPGYNGYSQDFVAYVDKEGFVFSYGYEMNSESGVRPALRINLGSEE